MWSKSSFTAVLVFSSYFIPNFTPIYTFTSVLTQIQNHFQNNKADIFFSLIYILKQHPKWHHLWWILSINCPICWAHFCLVGEDQFSLTFVLDFSYIFVLHKKEGFLSPHQGWGRVCPLSLIRMLCLLLLLASSKSVVPKLNSVMTSQQSLLPGSVECRHLGSHKLSKIQDGGTLIAWDSNETAPKAHETAPRPYEIWATPFCKISQDPRWWQPEEQVGGVNLLQCILRESLQ